MSSILFLFVILAGALVGTVVAQQPRQQDRQETEQRSSQSPQTDTERIAAADTLVLCPRPFFEELKPWLAYRSQQGHNIVVMLPETNAYGVKNQIRMVATYGNLKNVLLIGDTPSSDPASIEYTIPTDYIPADVIKKFGSEPEIATDNSYADLDSDGIPELAIGRLPVDSAEELAIQVKKILDYEATESGAWQRRINLVAGTGGFGQLSDTVIETTARRLISDLIPPEYDVSLTYASWASAYCPDPRLFTATTLQRLNEGSMFWVYMGHGHSQKLDYVRTPEGGYPILHSRDIPRIDCKQGMPIALMLACYTGAFDFPNDCLSEKMLAQPGGPISVICGSRVTMPYGMSMLSVGLIEEYFDGQSETLGQMLLAAKRKLVLGEKAIEDSQSGDAANPVSYEKKYRETIALLGKTLGPSAGKLDKEAIEHVHLFHLLGDPLLRVNRPDSIRLTVEPSDSHDRLVVKGTSPHAGEMLVELAYCRDRFHKRPLRRPEFNSDPDTLAGYHETYESSNERTVTQKQMTVPAGDFEFELEVPEWARGRCVVRGFLQNASETKRFALGASELRIKRR